MPQPTTTEGWAWVIAMAVIVPAIVAWITATARNSEIRRQFDLKAKNERTAAATNLFREIDTFYRTCEQRFASATLWIASNGEAGAAVIVGDLSLPLAVDSAATQLGAVTAVSGAVLRSTLGRAIDAENAAVGRGMSITQLEFCAIERRSLAALIVRSRELVYWAAKEAKLEYSLREKEGLAILRSVGLEMLL